MDKSGADGQTVRRVREGGIVGLMKRCAVVKEQGSVAVGAAVVAAVGGKSQRAAGGQAAT
jgi:hypothetical protein